MLRQVAAALSRDQWKIVFLLLSALFLTYLPNWTGWIALKMGISRSLIGLLMLAEIWLAKIWVPAGLGLTVYWASGTRLNRQSIKPLLIWILLWSGWVLAYGLSMQMPAKTILSWRDTLFPVSSFCWVYFGLCFTFFWRLLNVLLWLLFFPMMVAVLEKCSLKQAFSRISRHRRKEIAFWIAMIVYIAGYLIISLALSLPGSAPLPGWVSPLSLLAFMTGWIVMTYCFAVYNENYPKPFPRPAAPANESARQEAAAASSRPADLAAQPAAFFERLLVQDTPALQQMLAENPHLTQAVSAAKGNTPLHIAAWNGWDEIAAVIMQANPKAKHLQNADGKYPFELAQEQGHVQLAQQLR